MVFAILACLVAVSGQSAPPPAGQSEQVVLGADVVSLERVRKGIEQAGHLDLSSASSAGVVVPTFRVEILERRAITMQEAIMEFLAEPAKPANPGFLDDYPGPRRAGAGATPLIGGSVDVDPLFLIHWPQRWAQRRAAAKAKEEVEAELRALLSAQKDGAR